MVCESLLTRSACDGRLQVDYHVANMRRIGPEGLVHRPRGVQFGEEVLAQFPMRENRPKVSLTFVPFHFVRALRNTGATMRRQITTISDTITTRSSICFDGKVVVAAVTPMLRALYHARNLALRLTGRTLASSRAFIAHRERQVGSGMARLLKRGRLSGPWPCPTRCPAPGGANLGG